MSTTTRSSERAVEERLSDGGLSGTSDYEDGELT
jgi:hypothetical protein